MRRFLSFEKGRARTQVRYQSAKVALEEVGVVWPEDAVRLEVSNEIAIRELLAKNANVARCTGILRLYEFVPVRQDSKKRADDAKWLGGRSVKAQVIERADCSLEDELVELANSNKLMTAFEIADIARQLAEALIVLHKAGVAHNDVAPRNVLVVKHAGKTLYKLGDFGSAVCIGSDPAFPPYKTSQTPYAGSARTPPDGNRAGATADAWGLGVTMLELLCGSLVKVAPATPDEKATIEPTSDPESDRKRVSEAVRSLRTAANERISAAADAEKGSLRKLFDIVCQLSQEDPAKRATVESIVAKLAKLARER